MTTKFLLLLAGLMLAISLSACKQEDRPPVNCIDGFHEEDGKCVEDDPVCFAPSDYASELTYELVFEDNFDGTELNSEYWKVAAGGDGGGNNEIQLYTEDNHSVSDGFLTIEARYEEVNGYEYTSTRLNTRGKADFRYGLFEIRAKVPDGLGTWSAIWMMPTYSLYGGWPNSGEIDIMEHVGYSPKITHGTIHTRIYYHTIGTQKGGSAYVPDATSEFHTYQLEWLPDKLIFSVDDEVYFTYDPHKFSSCPTYNIWPYNKDFYLIMNVAVGGDWGGAQGVDPEDYPTQMVVDYVRVYQATELEGYDDKAN